MNHFCTNLSQLKEIQSIGLIMEQFQVTIAETRFQSFSIQFILHKPFKPQIKTSENNHEMEIIVKVI